MMKGSCHCGDVQITLAARPDYINLCDCSLCRKSGGAWGYFTSQQVELTGVTSAYRRRDYAEPAVELRFCPACGTTTHWILTEHHTGDRIGVNMRVFEPEVSYGIEARTLDGHHWFGETDADHRRPVGILGQDVFL